MHDKYALNSTYNQSLSSFKKTLIKEGKYIHPNDHWTLNVDSNRIKTFLSNFHQMKERGIKVPVLKAHSFEEPTSDNCVGYLEDMYVDEEGWLAAVHGLTDRGVDYAERVGQVSVGIERDYRDGLGNSYGEAITHVAITPIPVVPGQTDFQRVRVAASINCVDKCDILTLSREEKTMLNQNESKRLSQLLGQEVTSDDFIAIIEEKLGAADTVKKLQEQYSMSLKQIEDLEKNTVAKVDPEVLEDRAQLYGERITQLACSGKVPDAVAEGLKEVLCGPEDNRCALSLNTNGGRDKSFAKAIIELLEQIPPRVEFGIKTGPQTAVLDKKGRDGSGFSQDVHNKMLELAGLKAEKA